MSRSLTWGELARPWIVDPRKFAWLAALLPAAAAALVTFAPIAAIGLGVTLALAIWLWRDPAALALLLIALMVNVKVNYYTGFVTLLPEYPVLLVAGAIALLRAMEGRWRVTETGFMVLFAWFCAAGAASAANAVNLSRVISKGFLLFVAAAIFFAVIEGLRSRRNVARAFRWLEWSAAVAGGYGVAQIVGGAFNIDTSLSFLEQYSNPEFILGVGVPVVYQFAKFFRANAFFNDPNILAGYLAGVMSVVLALWLHHRVQPEKRGRARAEAGLLLLLAVALLLTLSRSGFLAFGAGLIAVLVFMPAILRRVRFWIAAAATLGIAAATAALSGINPLLLFIRLGQTFDRGDFSNRMHYDVAYYAVDLVRRFPLTGVGLRNFGYYYAAEVNATFPNMMAHNAWLDFFSETGLFGGLAFTAITIAVLRRPWRALRDPELRARDPELHAWNAALFGGLVAINVANLFYDYYTRTFIWVLSGMAVAVARLWEERSLRAVRRAQAP